MKQLPAVRTDVDQVWLDGGLDLISPPGYAKPGTCRFATNYELEFGGGYRRMGGFERYSGQFQPHLAAYVLLEASAGITGVDVGDTVEGATSGATGEVIYVTATRVAMTKIVGGPFDDDEVLEVSSVAVGTVTDDQPVIDGFLDNELSELAANVYRADIGKPGGTDVLMGPIRGVAVLNNVVYCWRDDAGALVTYKATGSGWAVVPLYSQVSFTGGSTEYVDGSTLTQGANSATVKRAVLESGTWAAGTAAGRLIVLPVAGTFTAGIAGGGGVCTLSGAAAAITQFGAGRVDSAVFNFTANLANKRLYCCDGVNIEWEFDGDVIVPLTTGMGGIRATRVAVFKNHLFYAYRSSLQHSGTGEPYQWTPLLGAGEIGLGDRITNLRTVSGSESAGSLMAICENSTWVLYGSDDESWQLVQISEEAGAQAFSAQEVGGIMAFDHSDFRLYRPTDTFGNFAYESQSRAVEPLVRNATVMASVLAKNKNTYRCFFSDGLILTGTPTRNGFGWMASDYGRTIHCAVGAEINGEYRIFMGDFDGWVLEADVGRSFDGGEVVASMRMSSQNQKNTVTLKQYRHAEIVSFAESAFTYAISAEFDAFDADGAVMTASTMSDFRRQYGGGLFWDFNSWDRAYWDVNLSNQVRFDIHGQGRSVTIVLQSISTNQMPHTLKTTAVLYSTRRLDR